MGGQPLTTEHMCDDGNIVGGDGCSSECQFERNYVCIQTALAQGLEVSKCQSKTVFEFIESPNSLVPLTYELNFSRSTNLSKVLLSNGYRLVLRLSSSTPDSSAVDGELQISYKFFTNSQSNFILEIDGNQFKNSVKGTLMFRLHTVEVSTEQSNRLVQDVELDEIKDEDSMPVELEGPNVELDFDYDEFHGD